MSTITKELAKLFRKITNSEIDAEGNAHVVLSPADSLLINNARIALASLEAEAVACIDRANLDYLESGADADVWPASGAGSDDVLLYAAPQLPQPAVFVPSIKPDWMNNEFNAGRNACRTAMLQDGNHTEQHLDMVDHFVDASEKGKDGTLINESTMPATQIKPVADLYGITSPTGSETTFTFDAGEASSFVGSGWTVQEYVELERYQEAITGK